MFTVAYCVASLAQPLIFMTDTRKARTEPDERVLSFVIEISSIDVSSIALNPVSVQCSVFFLNIYNYL